MARFRANTDSGSTALTSRRARNVPKIVRTPTNSGRRAAITPRNTQSDSTKRIGNARSSARARSAPTCSPIAGPDSAAPPTWTPSPPSSRSWRSSAASSASASGRKPASTAARLPSVDRTVAVRATAPLSSSRVRTAAASATGASTTSSPSPPEPASPSSRSPATRLSASGSLKSEPSSPSSPATGPPNPTARTNARPVMSSTRRARRLMRVARRLIGASEPPPGACSRSSGASSLRVSWSCDDHARRRRFGQAAFLMVE
jgi:hypothetical protein